MISAYILVQTEVGRATSVSQRFGELRGVTSVDGVTGPYDVIARAEARDLDSLARDVVLRMQDVDGVTRTLTCPILDL
jgi:DNA-binding Lrp family transcriptional regulator